MRICRLPIVVALTAFAAVPLLAGPLDVVERETARVQTEEAPWSFRLAMYGWMQSLDGTVGVRGIESEIDVPFSEILEDLNFGVMGTLEVRHKRWGFMADMVYAKLSGSAATPFDIFFSEVDYEQKQFTGNFILSYRLVDQAKFGLEAYAGARVNYLDSEITLVGNQLPLPPSLPAFIIADRSFGGSKTWVDPIVGGRFQAALGGPFFLRAGGDIGGFGVSSEFTWQAYGVLGVNAARNFSIGLGYRGLGTDYSSGGFKYDVIAHGPLIGAEFRF